MSLTLFLILPHCVRVENELNMKWEEEESKTAIDDKEVASQESWLQIKTVAFRIMANNPC